jgi:hypothetical protein
MIEIARVRYMKGEGLGVRYMKAERSDEVLIVGIRLKTDFSNGADCVRSTYTGMKNPEHLNSMRGNTINDQIGFQNYIAVHPRFSPQEPAFGVHIVSRSKIIYNVVNIFVKLQGSCQSEGFNSILKKVFKVVTILF